MSFSNLGLSDALCQQLEKLGYQKPTPVQTKALPVILQGHDLLAAAPTGTGKTASFVLPILEKLKEGKTERKKRARAIILTPTRELALQIFEHIEQYKADLPLRAITAYGGTSLAPQIQALIEGVDILVATPGRLWDLYTQRAIRFDESQYFVLDEADRMLSLGFQQTLDKIIDALPRDKQSLLFSATLSPKVKELAKNLLELNAKEINLARSQEKGEIKQWLIPVDKDKKSALLSHLIQQKQWQKTIIFIETKHGAAKLVEQLAKRGIIAEAFHSGRSQASREQVLNDFKQGKVPLLVATGVAARGLDIEDLPRVVNYDLPFPAAEYIHRIGRTGRAGAQGEAISFLSKDDFKNLCMIEKFLDKVLERVDIEGFEPRKPIPISRLDFIPKSKRN